MSDKPPKKRARSVMGDDERAMQPRPSHAHTSAFGTPVYVDPERTPPPMEPPPPRSLPGYGTIAPEIREQIDAQNETITELTAGLRRLWDARHDSARLQQIDEHIQTLRAENADHAAAIEEFLKPAIKSLMGQVQLLVSYFEHNKARLELFFEREWPAAEKKLDALDSRLDRIERTQDRQESEFKSYTTSSQLDMNAVRNRIAVIESHVDIIRSEKRDREAGDKRELAIVKRQRRFFGAIVATVATVASTVINHLGDIAAWFHK